MKLLVGRVPDTFVPKYNPIQKRIMNIKSIWNNDHHEDKGIEKIVRLFLSSSQLLFPGTYIKYLAGKKGYEYQDLAMDAYILLKVTFPLVILMNHWEHNDLIIWIMMYLLLETILYIPTLIFASDLFSKPRSYRRSMLLLFFNYLETIFAFATLYKTGNYLNRPLENWFDAVYHSFVTASTIGFGDYYPITKTGKMLTILQVIQFLLFVVLFLNFFSTKIKSKGYFESDGTV